MPLFGIFVAQIGRSLIISKIQMYLVFIQSMLCYCMSFMMDNSTSEVMALSSKEGKQATNGDFGSGATKWDYNTAKFVYALHNRKIKKNAEINFLFLQ